MNRNSKNQDSSDEESPVGIKKTTYWELYGVKRFPYRGKRKFAPLLSQSFNGGMVISNDVFGLTISQFEQVYQACLERRNTKEQWILNLRYPDKSSKEYLNYLEECTECNKDYLHFLEKDPREKYLYEHLVKTVGTELDIRKKQRFFIILDKIVNSCLTDHIQISSGSLAEGIDLPGSDIDVMIVINDLHGLDVIQNVGMIKHPINRNIYVMETDIDHPGFTRLKKVERYNGTSVNEACDNYTRSSRKRTQLYLSTTDVLDIYKQHYPNQEVIIHGPCISDKKQTRDIAFCIRSKYLPNNAVLWAARHRWQWPTNIDINRIVKYGCMLVPIGPKILSDDDTLWRVSFSVAEKILVYSFNFTQLLCYGLLKLILKRILNKNDDVKDLVCSYFLKSALFWVSEEVDIDTFQISKIYYCFTLCFEKLISWVNTCYCPNYFIPEHNMFIGKINQRNNKILVGVLRGIQSRGITELINDLFLLNNEHCCLSSTKTESCIHLDFILYRNMSYTKNVISGGISSYYKALSCIIYLLKSESSAFIIDACKWYGNIISTHIVHLLPSPNTKGNTFSKWYPTKDILSTGISSYYKAIACLVSLINSESSAFVDASKLYDCNISRKTEQPLQANTIGFTYNIRKYYHIFFQRIIKTDAVSGWLLYASFHYVTGQFNVTLRITEYVLSKCIHCLILTDIILNIESRKNEYRHHVHSSMTLNERLTIATARHFQYGEHSSLVPEEIQLEVDCSALGGMNILSNVICHCLRFLCYHHLGDLPNRRQAFRDLYIAVKDKYMSINTESNALTILGVCFEISGDKDMAYQCYADALQCDTYVCPSAELRISTLLNI